MTNLYQLVYFMLPAYLANMAPPFTRFWKGWNRPISRRWLGSHKTVLGFGLGVAVALATALVQSRIHWGGDLWPRDQWPALGLAFGLGAMGGDSLKSLAKRLQHIPPGQSWIPLDQLDFVVGALIGVLPWVRLPWADVALLLIVSFIGDVVVNHLSFWCGIRATRW